MINFIIDKINIIVGSLSWIGCAGLVFLISIFLVYGIPHILHQIIGY